MRTCISTRLCWISTSIELCQNLEYHVLILSHLCLLPITSIFACTTR